MSNEDKKQLQGYLFSIKKHALKGEYFSAASLTHALFEFLKEKDPENTKHFKEH